MARKNRPTLKQQFAAFINRIAPFDGNPLIQKPEHNQVEDDLFDSVLTNTDSEQLINNPGALFNVDFSTFDLYNVDSSASIATAFTITVNNLGTGQLGRINITKKSNDTYNFSNASLNGINNLNQTGLTSIQFYVLNVNDNLFVLSSLSIAKSDATNSNNSNQLATSKAVRDLNNSLQSQIDTNDSDISDLNSTKADNDRGNYTTKSGTGNWDGEVFARNNLGNIIHIYGTVRKAAAGANIIATGFQPPVLGQTVVFIAARVSTKDYIRVRLNNTTLEALDTPISNEFYYISHFYKGV